LNTCLTGVRPGELAHTRTTTIDLRTRMGPILLVSKTGFPPNPQPLEHTWQASPPSLKS
jgi:hypothetical protein